MSVELEIPDGSPHWWASTDIWTVPGDPGGSPGMPVVGEPCYLYARVTNNGSTPVQNATVRFYWADPSVGFDRNTANHIGDANVSLNAGETQEVLCLVPWDPVYVNEGHECVLAEAFHPTSDPLPATPVFNVPTDRHVAQRNLSVVRMLKSQKMFSFNFQVCNTERIEREFELEVKQGKLAELRPLLKQLDHDVTGHTEGKLVNAGFTTNPHPCNEPEDQKAVRREPRAVHAVRPQTCGGLTLVGELEGDAALVHVVQRIGKREIGGLSVLVVREDGLKPLRKLPEMQVKKPTRKER